MRWLKLLLAILLLPACVALTLTGWRVAGELAGRLDSPVALAFWTGYGLWFAVFLLLPRPTRTYVLGHELTHALWALLMGARVSGLRVGKGGGQVKTSKTNWLIVLAPYFFPFYAMLFIAGFFLVRLCWPLDRYLWVLFFLVGLGWSFHVTFTLTTLLEVDQPDVRSQGWLFSMVVIYSMNLLVMALTAAALSDRVTFGELAWLAGQDLRAAYGWTLDKLAWLWHHAAAVRKGNP
jgi:hypothetical protein